MENVNITLKQELIYAAPLQGGNVWNKGVICSDVKNQTYSTLLHSIEHIMLLLYLPTLHAMHGSEFKTSVMIGGHASCVPLPQSAVIFLITPVPNNIAW